MSINVTVSGNPVRISRGKMVTYDPTKAEFEKRRLMRLEQVRQQSKDIAENIRNKLKKEKTKCLSEIEKEGEVKLKNWQARKLLELQNQYQEVLDDIGLGHREAIQVEDEENVLVEQQQVNEKVAKERGRIAAERVQIEKNEENLKKAVPVQRKKMTRDFENDVAKSKSKKEKKKITQVFDSDSENKIPPLVGLTDSDLESLEYIRTTKKSTQILKACKSQQTSPVDFQVPTSDKALQTVPSCEISKTTRVELPLDTRISERIKQREKMAAKEDYCDLNTNTLCHCCKCPVRVTQELTDPQNVPSQYFHKPDDPSEDKDLTEQQKASSQTKWDPSRSQVLTEPQKASSQFQTQWDPSRSQYFTESQNASSQLHTKLEPNRSQDLSKPQKTTSQHLHKPQTKLNPSRSQDLTKSQPSKVTQNFKTTLKGKSEIPSKPKITLRSVKDRPGYLGGPPPTDPVQFYDHPNRYSKSYVPQTSHLNTIVDEELEISPSALSDEDIKEKMRHHDKEAQIRGAVALEKEKLQREYRELLRKLPVLQKQERMCEIGLDKEKYHMSRDRLEELEKKRQNRLDNAYEELFVRRRPPIVTLSKKIYDQDEPQTLNLATWDTYFDPSKSRTEQLNDLLTNLKSQKDSLLKEIETTLSKETINQIAKTSLDDVKSKSTDYSRVKTKRKRSRTSPTKTVSSTRTTSPSPKKKPKLKVSTKKVKILQNTSTQTTPKTDQSVSTSPKLTTPVTEPAPCLCPKNLDDLCEIVIKIKDDEKPEVVVNPPFLGNSVKIVTEDLPKEKEERKKTQEEPKKTEEEPKRLKKTGDLPKQKGDGTVSDAPPKIDESKKNGSWREQLSNTLSSRSTSSTSYRQLPNTKSPPPRDISRTRTPTPEKQLDPRLITYIKKLLNMSRASIDDLTVSAASDVSTPSHSVVETPSNNPLNQLRNVMRYFNIDAAELQKQLSYSTDESSKHYNTSESITVSSSSSDGQFKSCIDVDPKREEPKKVLQQYADVTASCTKKISDLTAMIEKVREEKKRMLQSSTSSSEKDLTTTSYKELPEKKDKNEQSKSPTQEELDKQLLGIDYSYAQKLKELSKDQIQTVHKHVEQHPSDAELLTRLKILLKDKDESYKPPLKDRTVALVSQNKILLQESTEQPVILTTEKKLVEQTEDAKTVGTSSEIITVSLKPPTEQKPTPPLFLDIPKLPKLETPSLDKKKKRPPPSKGMRAVTGKTPHELSTILEADSHSKLEDVPDIITDTHQRKDKSQSSASDDVSEMETMETMLVSIGMEWAIPTLKKTREALALSSSSSGEVSLREFLSKISSSSSKSGEDGSMNDTQGVSMINVDNRRTSTPIVDKKGVEGPVFMTDSDLSSVKEHSERKDSEEKFFDFNDGSLTKTR